MLAQTHPGPLAYVIGTYPLLTTTFVDREIQEVERSGGAVMIVSLRRPDGRPLSDEQRETAHGVEYARPISVWSLIRSHLRFLFRRPLTMASLYVSLPLRSHPNALSRVRTVLHVGLGVVVASMLARSQPRHIHAHFIDRAATVAWVASRLLDVPFSITAHANDIYVSPVLLADKIGAAKFTVTCTEYNLAYLRSSVQSEGPVEAIHHGIRLESFPTRSDNRDSLPMVLSVGQLKEKKGFRYLLQAVASIADRKFELVIVGEGPLRADLESMIDELGIGERVTLVGAVPHGRVVELMQSAAIFTLPAVIASDGDRDGIPNVILEAMAMSLPVVSTLHSGIPEAVIDGITGLLVEPKDVDALAGAITRLLDEPDQALRMGQEGRDLVAQRFDLTQNVARLLDLVGS